MEPKKSAGSGGGLRERKRQETLARITEVGLGLFNERGFEATTLDAIAEAAGISRRTFFHYFKSKDDILLTQTSMGDSLSQALDTKRPEAQPMEALREAILGLLANYAPEELVALDRMMLSSQAVQARKQATYLQDEKTLYLALCRHWPQREPMALRLIAMLSIGVIRIAMETWRQTDTRHPLQYHVEQGFSALETAFGTGARTG